MISPENAGKLLEEVVFDRVLSFIDLEGLFQFEQELWGALADVGVDADEIAPVAKEMIDRAFQRFTDDDRRYGTFGTGSSFDCDLCQEEAAHARGSAAAAERGAPRTNGGGR